MKKISRNAQCPCGSEKKYKKCCLQKDEEGHVASIKKIEATKNSKHAESASEYSKNVMLVEDDLDLLSNNAVYLINEGEFEKAKEKCEELLSKYPDVVDGFDRFAMLYEASGEKEKAAEYYRRSADFMRSSSGYSEELIDFALGKVELLS